MRLRENVLSREAHTCWLSGLHGCRVPDELWKMPLPESDCDSSPFRYLFPRQLLVKHFWTPKQQIDFLDIYHGLRKQSHSEIIAHLGRVGDLVSDEKLRWHLTDLCAKVPARALEAASTKAAYKQLSGSF